MNILRHIGIYLARDEIERVRKALEVTQQALMEVRHAQECGPGWYTRGERGMYQQTSMWVRKGLDAAREGLESRRETLKDYV